MTTATHAAMHRDHRQWTSELKSWGEDLEQWMSELKSAHTLAEIGLQKHLALLESHIEAVRQAKQQIAAYEHAVADNEQSGQAETTVLDASLQEAHRRQAAETESIRDAHHQLRRHHHTIITHLAALNRALDIHLE